MDPADAWDGHEDPEVFITGPDASVLGEPGDDVPPRRPVSGFTRPLP